jgi:hypothetical protein
LYAVAAQVPSTRKFRAMSVVVLARCFMIKTTLSQKWDSKLENTSALCAEGAVYWLSNNLDANAVRKLNG